MLRKSFAVVTVAVVLASGGLVAWMWWSWVAAGKTTPPPGWTPAREQTSATRPARR